MGTCFGMPPRHSRDWYEYGGGYYGGNHRRGDYLHDRHGQPMYADQMPGAYYRDDPYYDRPYSYYPETTLYADDLRYCQPVQAIRYSPGRLYDRDGFY